MHTLGRVLRAAGLAVALLVLGAVVGLASVVGHAWWPVLVLSALVVVALVVALPRRWWSRPPFAVGFTVVVALASVPRPEGDYLVGSDPAGYALLGLAVVLVVATAATLPRRRGRATPSDSLR